MYVCHQPNRSAVGVARPLSNCENRTNAIYQWYLVIVALLPHHHHAHDGRRRAADTHACSGGLWRRLKWDWRPERVAAEGRWSARRRQDRPMARHGPRSTIDRLGGHGSGGQRCGTYDGRGRPRSPRHTLISLGHTYHGSFYITGGFMPLSWCRRWSCCCSCGPARRPAPGWDRGGPSSLYSMEGGEGARREQATPKWTGEE